MGITIETEIFAEASQIIELHYDAVEHISQRVYSSIKNDIRKRESNSKLKKIESIENKIGNVDK
jgi:uncharacterized protein YqgV (UPF0045/DUF77 family)